MSQKYNLCYHIKPIMLHPWPVSTFRSMCNIRKLNTSAKEEDNIFLAKGPQTYLQQNSLHFYGLCTFVAGFCPQNLGTCFSTEN